MEADYTGDDVELVNEFNSSSQTNSLYIHSISNIEAVEDTVGSENNMTIDNPITSSFVRT
jgi:hypothetical protein